MELPNIIKSIFYSMKEGILIVDKKNHVVFANEAYIEFIGKSAEDIIGKDLRSFRPSARLPEVVARGEKIVHAVRTEGSSEQVYFVNMYPIIIEGEILGGISVVVFIDDAYDVKKALEKHEQYVKCIMSKMNEVNYRINTFDSLVAVSPGSVAAKELARKIATTDATVLLQSESGTGKEVYARAIHYESSRSSETFLAINCASFNSSLLESELFGYIGGSFTGAEKKGKMGVFEAAKGGTLFLDEISEIDLEFQAKLLRALQEHFIRPVGALKEIPVDVRVICACNANLKEYVACGKFRKDLYYRLNTFTIEIPPLRERREDIPILTEHILKEFSEKLKKNISITEDVLACFMNHEWPGNVRELRNVLEFGAYLSEDGVIRKDMLPGGMYLHTYNHGIEDEICLQYSLQEKVRQFERNEIRKMLTLYGEDVYGKKLVAERLGISLASLYNKLK